MPREFKPRGPQFCISVLFLFSFDFFMKKGGLYCLEIISRVFDAGESKERGASFIFCFSSHVMVKRCPRVIFLVRVNFHAKVEWKKNLFSLEIEIW
jgi:hypothetical protein